MNAADPHIKPPPRRWWRRLVPARIRLHTRLIAVSTVVMVLVAVMLGSFQMRPIVFSQEVFEPPAITVDVRGTVDLFDTAEHHTISISLSDTEYQVMVRDFQRSGEKTWVRADAVIDGTELKSVGVRLKGNSTLMSLRGAGARPGGGMRSMPGGFPSGMPPMPGGFPSGMPPMPGGDALPGSPAPGGAAAPAGPSMSNVSFDRPSSLPLVLSFDHFIGGRGYQGRSELAIRPITGQGTDLNEAVALQLIEESGQKSQRFTWVRFSLNGDEETTRLVIENPDQNYAVGLRRGPGALYKSRSTNSFTYKGEDATQYVDDFKQVSAKGSLDMKPVISLLQFIESASDARFDAELASWVDVESFARYVATHDLLNNFDDMAGPGRNFLLWYDAGDERFTVISWDMNLAITGMGGPGGPRPGGGGPAPGGPAPGGPAASGNPGAASPIGSAPRGWMPPGAGSARAGMPPSPGGGRAMRMGNTLKTRFVGTTAFAEPIAAAKAELSALWFGDDHAIQIARELAKHIPTSAGLTAEQIDGELATLTAQLRELAAKAH